MTDVLGIGSSRPELRQRLRAARGRPRAHVPDHGHLQPGVRPAGVPRGGGLLRHARRAPLADARWRWSSRSGSSRRWSASLLDRGCSATCAPRRDAAKLVSVLGLFVAIPQMVFLWFGQNPKYERSRHRARTASITYNPFDNVFVSRDDLAIDRITGLVVFVGLTLLLRYTALGLRMRAVVESPRMTELAGVDADRVEHDRRGCCRASSPGSPACCSRRCSRAGRLTPTTQTLVDRRDRRPRCSAAHEHPARVRRRAAARRAQQLARRGTSRRTASSRAACGPRCRSSCCSCVLIFSPSSAQPARVADPLAGVDPPPPRAGARRRAAESSRARPACSPRSSFCSAIGYYLFFHAERTLGRPRGAAAILVDHLLVDHRDHRLRRADLVVPGDVRRDRRVRHRAARDAARRCRCCVAMVIGALIAAAVGALVALPALRLGGIFLSLATLAFAFFFDHVIVQLDWVGGGLLPIAAPRPIVGLDRLQHERQGASWCLTLVILTIVSVVVIWVRERHDRAVPRRAARERGRGRVDRHQPRTGRASSRSRSRRRSPASAAGCSRSYERPANFDARLRARVRSRLDRARRDARVAHRRGRDQRRRRLRLLRGGRAPHVDPVDRQPRAALVPHELVAGRARNRSCSASARSPTPSIPKAILEFQKRSSLAADPARDRPVQGARTKPDPRRPEPPPRRRRS